MIKIPIMRINIITSVFTWVLMILTVSCELDENPPYDLKFIHIMHNNSSEVSVNAMANTVATYNVYLSSGRFTETVTVTYDIIAGDGLEEGDDYEVLNKNRKLEFRPGIYDMPNQIQWHINPVDPEKHNKLKIQLKDNRSEERRVGKERSRGAVIDE